MKFEISKIMKDVKKFMEECPHAHSEEWTENFNKEYKR